MFGGGLCYTGRRVLQEAVLIDISPWCMQWFLLVLGGTVPIRDPIFRLHMHRWVNGAGVSYSGARALLGMPPPHSVSLMWASRLLFSEHARVRRQLKPAPEFPPSRCPGSRRFVPNGRCEVGGLAVLPGPPLPWCRVALSRAISQPWSSHA